MFYKEAGQLYFVDGADFKHLICDLKGTILDSERYEYLYLQPIDERFAEIAKISNDLERGISDLEDAQSNLVNLHWDLNQACNNF